MQINKEYHQRNYTRYTSYLDKLDQENQLLYTTMAAFSFSIKYWPIKSSHISYP